MLKPFCPEAKVMDHASIIIIPKCIQTRDTRMMGVAVTYSCPCSKEKNHLPFPFKL
jgi:hypothetical protein